MLLYYSQEHTLSGTVVLIPTIFTRAEVQCTHTGVCCETQGVVGQSGITSLPAPQGCLGFVTVCSFILVIISDCLVLRGLAEVDCRILLKFLNAFVCFPAIGSALSTMEQNTLLDVAGTFLLSCGASSTLSFPFSFVPPHPQEIPCFTWWLRWRSSHWAPGRKFSVSRSQIQTHFTEMVFFLVCTPTAIDVLNTSTFWRISHLLPIAKSSQGLKKGSTD